MQLNFTWINLLILFGALQGLIFCIILLFNRKHPGARFLSAFMLVLSYNGFETFNWSAGLDRYNIFFDLFSFIIIYGLGPSLYLYCTSLLQPERKISTATVLKHYSPVILQFILRSGIIVYHILWVNKIIDSPVTSGQLDGWYGIYAEPLSILVFLSYLIASIRAFRQHRQSLSVKALSKEHQTILYRWIKILLITMTVLAVAWIATVLSPVLFNLPSGQYYYPIELGLVLFIYWIVLNGYHQVKIIYPKAVKSRVLLQPDTSIEKQLELLRHAMEKDKLFLDPELNISKVALHTGLPAKTISALLNQQQQTSFNDFVNRYRVEEVRGRLLDEESQHLTISGMALESGFNSQATFQRAFKHVMGLSPREYIQTSLKKTG